MNVPIGFKIIVVFFLSDWRHFHQNFRDFLITAKNEGSNLYFGPQVVVPDSFESFELHIMKYFESLSNRIVHNNGTNAAIGQAIYT